jgi:16S rRNA (guanine527-N7)-methyltransferase
VTPTGFAAHLSDRARRANVDFSPEILPSLEAYVSILSRWNARMNLTALELNPPTDETLDRLIIEPLAAARHVPDDGSAWFDLGSGGGSPAIPLKIARPSLQLVMVESKARKAAFLRETVRALGLEDSKVENSRFEVVADGVENVGIADVVTVRAVKPDAALFVTAAGLLREDGRLLLFRPSDESITAEGFKPTDTFQLLDSSRAFLAIFKRVFHVEQTS